jgi:hypothetical protein
MACRITDDVINALQHCRLKAYFRLRDEEGIQSGYEKLLIEQRANAQRKAIEKIRREYREAEVATDLNLSVANLRKGTAFILSARLDDDRHAVAFDAHGSSPTAAVAGCALDVWPLSPLSASPYDRPHGYSWLRPQLDEGL